MHEQLTALLDDGPWRTWKHRPGGVYLLRADRMAEARAHAARGRRARRPARRPRHARPTSSIGRIRPRGTRRADRPSAPAACRRRAASGDATGAGRARRRCILSNGLGGFTDDGKDYVIVLEGDQETPLPWANVIANPAFGTIVTASGSAYTWSENSRENRLTPFANDPVVDPTAEALFIRDDETGRCLVADAGADAPDAARAARFVIRHSAGLTHVQPRRVRHRPRARRVRGRDRSREVLAADADQPGARRLAG